MLLSLIKVSGVSFEDNMEQHFVSLVDLLFPKTSHENDGLPFMELMDTGHHWINSMESQMRQQRMVQHAVV